MTLDDVRTMVRGIVGHSVDPADAELDVAINHGYRALIRTIRDLRGEYFLQENPAFVLPASTPRVPLNDPTQFPQPVRRVRRVIGLGAPIGTTASGIGYGSGGYGSGPYGGGGFSGPAGSGTPRAFRFCSISAPEFQAAEWSATPAAAGETVLYDLLYPGGVPTLAVAPLLGEAEVVLIETITEPVRLVLGADMLEPIVADHIDPVLCWAVEWVLRAVNDPDADRWGLDAQALRQAVAQDLALRGEQHTQGVGSALAFLGDD